MLSLLLTAIVLLGALVATLHLRSSARAAAVVALAAAISLALSGRALDDLSKPRLHLEYEIQTALAAEAGPDLAARAGAQVRARLHEMGLTGAAVDVKGDALDVVTPVNNEEDALRLKESLGITGALEFTAVDDDLDFFAPYLDDQDGAPKGLRVVAESAPTGPGIYRTRKYAQWGSWENESDGEALRRLEKWAETLPVPKDRRVAFQRVTHYDDDLERFESIGWRTMVLHRTPILTHHDIARAEAQPDTQDGKLLGWRVSLQLTAEGERLFAEATERLVHRRFAIVLDGVVESAPVVMSRIDGGAAIITMGAGSPDVQASQAARLAAALRSGPLPAPLSLSKEELLPAPMSPGASSALVIAAALLLVAELFFALWLTFRRDKSRPATAPLAG